MPIGPVQLPRLGAQSPDTHAHLDMLDDPAGALERATMAGTMFIVTVDDPTEAPGGSLEDVGKWCEECQERLDHWEIPHGETPEVRVIVGTHPHNAKDHSDKTMDIIRQLADDPLVVGVGEMGLDFFHDHSPRDRQREVFREQLALAHELKMPAVVHLRDAHDEGYEILSDIGVPEAGCVIHCFTEGPETAERFLELGCMLSFAGPLTFRKNDELRAALDLVPLDRLLFETDCPFMPPEPYRGRTNEPGWVTLTIERAATVKGLPTEVVSLSALENARRVFGGQSG